MLEFAPNKGLLVEEVPAPKMGDLDSFGNPSCWLTGCKGFKRKNGKGRQCVFVVSAS